MATTTPVRAVPAERYTSDAFLEQERAGIFGRSWLVAGPEQRLREANSWFVFEALGESIVVTRTADGAVHAFHNACAHRGSRIAVGSGCSERLQCPYHGWIFQLDGTLQGATKRDGLGHRPGSLKPVQADTWMGQVWVNLDLDAPPLADFLGSALIDDVATYAIDAMTPIQTFSRKLPSNWKVLLENAIETYHVGAVHPRSVGRAAVKQLDLVSFGDHSRQRQDVIAEVPGRARLDRACARGGPYTDVQLRALHKYLIFPNFLMNLLPYHVTFMQVFPLTPTTCELRYTFARRKGARGIELARAVGTWLGSRWILREDLSVLRAFQDGAATGRLRGHRLHEDETAIGHFHAVIERWFEGEQ
ncbi:MAG: aromatic ring-hydroxylating dioxygenase subunit alpha [Proteobacteria bacterium]|nr:aromatic ring-hydroxylating dioxygenase subunit alpha [Pseudomonadota bacterium]